MSYFAQIDADGRVAEIIPGTVVIDGKTITLEMRYHPDFIAGLVPYDPENPPPEPEPPAPSPEEMVKALTDAVQAAMDSRAQMVGYDDIKTAITYRGDPNAKFSGEAEAFFSWRSAVWTQAYAHLALVQAGEAPMPTVEEAIAMMPALELP